MGFFSEFDAWLNGVLLTLHRHEHAADRRGA